MIIWLAHRHSSEQNMVRKTPFKQLLCALRLARGAPEFVSVSVSHSARYTRSLAQWSSSSVR